MRREEWGRAGVRGRLLVMGLGEEKKEGGVRGPEFSYFEKMGLVMDEWKRKGGSGIS